ncbi:MAG TPA: hypothetical protein VN886_15590 [Acidimicrobiales bacterium]|nr:hypothetical protein [Acidimicrobiales bacterium]
MQRGHPFWTRALDDKRAEQRRKLRAIPSWLFEPSHYAPGPTVTINGVADNAFVETQVRRQADAELNLLAPLLSEWEIATAEDALGWFVRNNVDKATRNVQGHANDLLAEVEDRLPVAGEPRKLDPKYAAPLARAILLLAWADDLSDDGYLDPRIAEHREPTT